MPDPAAAPLGRWSPPRRPSSSASLPISSEPSKSVCQNSFMITAAQKVGIAAGKYQELQLPSCPHQPRSRVPDLVGSRLPSPYHFRARIQSFQGVAAPFPGDSVLPSASRAAIPGPKRLGSKDRRSARRRPPPRRRRRNKCRTTTQLWQEIVEQLEAVWQCRKSPLKAHSDFTLPLKSLL